MQKVKPGIELVLDTIGFDAHVRDADLVITGEGRLDAQSAYGKVPCGVATRSKAIKNVPVVALGGAIGDGADALHSCGVDALVAAVSRVCTLDEAMASTEQNIIHSSRQAANLIRAGMSMKAE